MLDWPTLTLPPINLWNVPHSSNMSRIFMRRVGKHHSLVLDTSTDASHVISLKGEILLTFDSSLYVYEGESTDKPSIAKISVKGEDWVTLPNTLGITTDPISFRSAEGTFDVEQQFAQKWLELKGIEA